jgi:hypothetical protein
VAYSIRAEGLDERELEALDIEIGMTEDPADEAREALRAHQEAQGMRFENPDGQVEPSQDGLEPWMVTDEEVR